MIVFLSIDFDADSAERLYYSDKPVKLSKALFSIRKGIYRVLELLDMFDIKTTFFTPGWVIENYPDLVKEIMQRGHELGMHGYMHEKLDELSVEEERKIHEKAVQIIRSFQGFVAGFRKPYWELSPSTLEIISSLGISYDSSLCSDDEPYFLNIKDRILVELPIYDTLDDWLLFEIQYRSSEEVFKIWRYEFDSALEMNLDYFPLIVHPACIGRASRIRMLRELIVYMIRRGASFLPGKTIAEKVLKRARNESRIQ